MAVSESPKKKKGAQAQVVAPVVEPVAEPGLAPVDFKPIPYEVGRPTEYLEEYCKLVVEWGERGETIAFMCDQLCVGRSTFYDWQHAHPEFLRAYEISKMKSQNRFEQRAKKLLVEVAKDGTTKLNTNYYKWHLGNNFKDTYNTKDAPVVMDADETGAQTSDSISTTFAAMEEIVRTQKKPSDAKS